MQGAGAAVGNMVATREDVNKALQALVEIVNTTLSNDPKAEDLLDFVRETASFLRGRSSFRPQEQEAIMRALVTSRRQVMKHDAVKGEQCLGLMSTIAIGCGFEKGRSDMVEFERMRDIIVANPVANLALGQRFEQISMLWASKGVSSGDETNLRKAWGICVVMISDGLTSQGKAAEASSLLTLAAKVMPPTTESVQQSSSKSATDSSQAASR